MPEHLAVDANEHPVIESSLPTPLHIRLARYISNILAPASVSLPFVLLVAFYHAQSLGSAFYYACITLFFLSFGPMIYIIIGVRLGRFSDVDVSRRSERVGPFLFGITSVSLGYILLYFSHGPKNLQTLLLMTVVSGVVMMIITLWWKISIHASSLAGAITMLTALYGVIVLPTLVLLVLVNWSRVVLHRHTLAQVVGGSLISIALATFFLALRGV